MALCGTEKLKPRNFEVVIRVGDATDELIFSAFYNLGVLVLPRFPSTLLSANCRKVMISSLFLVNGYINAVYICSTNYRPLPCNSMKSTIDQRVKMDI